MRRAASGGHRSSPTVEVEVDFLGRNLLDKAHLVTPDARATLAPGRTGIATATPRF